MRGSMSTHQARHKPGHATTRTTTRTCSLGQRQISRKQLECRALFNFWQKSSDGSGSSGRLSEKLARPRDMVSLGPMKVSPMGLGTWAWGNQFLW